MLAEATSKIGMYRLMGAVARANQWLNTIDIHGLPLDVGLRVFLPLVGLLAWAVAMKDGAPVAWLVLTSSLLTYIALLHCRLHHGVVFRRADEFAILHNEEGAQRGAPPDFLASGRFILWEGDRTHWMRLIDRLLSGTRGDRWFLEVPATLVIHDEGMFSIAAFLDPSLRFMGISLGDEAGLWTIDGVFESLERLELGVMHLGFKTRPAIRLRFCNPKGRGRKVVLSFDDESKRRWFVNSLASAARSNWQGLY